MVILNSLHVNTNIDDDGGGENKCLKITDAVSFSSALSNREKLNCVCVCILLFVYFIH